MDRVVQAIQNREGAGQSMIDMREKCGVFGVWGSPTAAKDTYLGLYALQHRGQESAGIVVRSLGGKLSFHRENGLVTQVFSESVLNQMPGEFAIGHVRYSTSGSTTVKEIQPLGVTYRGTMISLAHNGNIINAHRLKKELQEEGVTFTGTSDSEVILQKIARSSGTTAVEKIVEGLKGVEVAYSLAILFEDGVAAVRDPKGFRPLFMGKKSRPLGAGKTVYFSSETCAFDLLEVEEIIEVQPGEGFFVSEKGIETFRLDSPAECRICSFEMIYFSRPDSLYREQSIHSFRLKLGAALFREHPIEADIVTPVPDSSNSAALGFSRASGIPLDLALVRSHYVGRTFIAPFQTMRDLKVKKKFNIIPGTVEGKRVVVIDDSVVRGTTSRKIIKMFRDRGAREVHLRVASPSVKFPCYFGIDMPDREEFLLNRVRDEDLAGYLEADTVGYLSEESLCEIVGAATCRACFSGNYPVEMDKMSGRIDKEKHESEYVYV